MPIPLRACRPHLTAAQGYEKSTARYASAASFYKTQRIHIFLRICYHRLCED